MNVKCPYCKGIYCERYESKEEFDNDGCASCVALFPDMYGGEDE